MKIVNQLVIIKKRIAKIPLFGGYLLIPFRARTALSYYSTTFSNIIKWLVKSKETTNFTYPLDPTNISYLCSLISDILGIDFNQVVKYAKEIKDNKELSNHILLETNKIKSNEADKNFLPGRRIGWYIFARALKPKIIVETGVDKGLGSCILTEALRKNEEEGYLGKYYGTDINPKAGYLMSRKYAKFGKILYGDSIESLKKLDCKIDLFINDSNHSKDYEAKEYETIKNKLSKKAVILGDNSHCTKELFKFSLKTNRHFIFFKEKPLNHWYPGGGIGISFKRIPKENSKR